MCDPMTLIGVATTLGGTAMNYAAQSRVQEARDDALAAERIRQRALDQEANAVNDTSRDRYKKFDKKQDRTAGGLQKYFTKQEVREPAKEAALPSSSSNITVAEERKQRASAQDFTNRTGEALGTLRSFGDLLGQKSLLQARDAGTVGQIGGFKAGSSNVLPLELDEASHAGDGLRLFADITGGLGGLALSKGLGSAAPFKPTTTLGGFLGASPTTMTAPANSMAAARALDRASVPRYAGLSSLYGV
jgi:hypothetical protein